MNLRQGAGLGICVIAVSLGGCNQPSRPPEAPRAVENVYGISLTLSVRDASGAEEFYTVDKDGTFGFGGGMDARFQRVSYSSTLDRNDMERLQLIIDHQRLLVDALQSSNDPPDARVRIALRTADKSINKSLKGEIERIGPLRKALKEFANRRLMTELERQPKPSAATQPQPGMK